MKISNLELHSIGFTSSTLQNNSDRFPQKDMYEKRHFCSSSLKYTKTTRLFDNNQEEIWKPVAKPIPEILKKTLRLFI